MNPGKIVRPYRLDDHLRLGASYQRPELATHFAFPDDEGSFAYATERCVGVGECRRLDSGTMCPSFMVTREEAHSTRGRAHLLFETMRGGLPAGQKSDAVRDALELCLSCKGCKHECPVNVDVATYKAEFLAHYYRGRLRPRAAYVFGFIRHWAKLGSLAPQLLYRLLRFAPVAWLIKRIAGVAPRRQLPAFASQTFRAWWHSRAQARAGSKTRPHAPFEAPESRRNVLLWVDTFNDHFQPEVLIAATEVLEAAGYHVQIPERALCCGRPLYDYGLLDHAKRYLRELLDALAPHLERGTPIVGLEPSCVAVFRDELCNLFPDDPAARALRKQALLFDELLERDASHWQLPRLERKAIVHGHCHHKAIGKLETQVELLRRLGLDAELLDAGCCGMAGGFGYQRDHYEVSVACGERVLLPAVRSTPGDALLIADGFSCREQIRQETQREALHVAQVLRMAQGADPSRRNGVGEP